MRDDPQNQKMSEFEGSISKRYALRREVEITGASADAAAGEPNAPTDANTGNFNPGQTEYAKRPNTIFVLIGNAATIASKTGKTDDQIIALEALKASQELTMKLVLFLAFGVVAFAALAFGKAL